MYQSITFLKVASSWTYLVIIEYGYYVIWICTQDSGCRKVKSKCRVQILTKVLAFSFTKNNHEKIMNPSLNGDSSCCRMSCSRVIPELFLICSRKDSEDRKLFLLQGNSSFQRMVIRRLKNDVFGRLRFFPKETTVFNMGKLSTY